MSKHGEGVSRTAMHKVSRSCYSITSFSMALWKYCLRPPMCLVAIVRCCRILIWIQQERPRTCSIACTNGCLGIGVHIQKGLGKQMQKRIPKIRPKTRTKVCSRLNNLAYRANTQAIMYNQYCNIAQCTLFCNQVTLSYTRWP